MLYPRPGNLAVFPGNATGVLILVSIFHSTSRPIDVIRFFKSARLDLKMLGRRIKLETNDRSIAKVSENVF